MKVSHAWLQTYFNDKIPEAKKLAELFTFHAFEVEDIEEKDGDTILDLKVLPDRAHYALSHRGIAREISFITGLEIDPLRIAVPEIETSPSSIFELEIKADVSRRSSKMVIQNIKNGPSPEWLKSALEKLGQRSISFIVDVTNFVMLDMGQPLHAFDLDKLVAHDGKYKLSLRSSAQDEKITLLGNKEVILPAEILVFADENNNSVPLDIAGIKGGNKAEVDHHTKNIVLLTDSFEPAYIRKASAKVGIRTDASKRFENNIPSRLTMDGLLKAAELILKESPHAVIEGIVDIYPKPEQDPEPLEVSLKEITDRLGITLSPDRFEALLKQLDFHFEKTDGDYIVKFPYYRLDITNAQDLAEEVGRIYGYDKIVPVLPKIVSTSHTNKIFYWTEKIKDLLVEIGYSEVYTYVLTSEGDIEIQNPLASDKGFLRNNLRAGIEKALIFNTHNAPLLGLDTIQIFEVGNIFTHEKLNNEHLSLCIGYFTIKSMKNKEKKSWEHLEGIVKQLGEKLGVPLSGILESTEAGTIFEEDLTALIEKLPEPRETDLVIPKTDQIYKPFSLYPFISRDIAVFVPEGVQEIDIMAIISEETAALLVRAALFDVFKKENKTSYAFRLVFQSNDRTLTDDEINVIMQRITDRMNSKEGWQVR